MQIQHKSPESGQHGERIQLQHGTNLNPHVAVRPTCAFRNKIIQFGQCISKDNKKQLQKCRASPQIW